MEHGHTMEEQLEAQRAHNEASRAAGTLTEEDCARYMHLAEERGDPEALLQAELFYGDYYCDAMELDRTFQHMSRAEQYVDVVKNANNIVLLYHLRGLCHMMKSNFVTALDCFYKVLDYLPRLSLGERETALMNVNINMAFIFNRVDEWDTAISYELAALEHLRSDHPQYREKYYSLMMNLAILNLNMKNYGEAIAYLDKLERVSGQEQDGVNHALYQAVMALLNYRESPREELYQEILSLTNVILEEQSTEFKTYVVLEVLYLFFIEVRDMDSFERVSRVAMDFQEQNHWMSTKLTTLKSAIDFYETMGKMEQHQQACVAFFKTQKRMDEQEKQERCKSIQAYIKIKDEESNQNALKHDNEELKKKSYYDQMTGLPNRYLFHEFCAKAFVKAKKKSYAISVEVIDVDHFKQFNDHYGHMEGDKCLIALAKEIAKTVAEGDMCARYGGDEFVILRMDKTAEELERRAYALRESIMGLGIPHAFSSAADVVTVSQGIVNRVPAPREELKDYLKSADEALYEAKKKAKNTVVLKED